MTRRLKLLLALVILIALAPAVAFHASLNLPLAPQSTEESIPHEVQSPSLVVLPQECWEVSGRNPYHTAYTDHFPEVKDKIFPLEGSISAGPIVVLDKIFVAVSGRVCEIRALHPEIIAESPDLGGEVTSLAAMSIEVLGIRRVEVFAAIVSDRRTVLYWLRENGDELQPIHAMVFSESDAAYLNVVGKRIYVAAGANLYCVEATVLGFRLLWRAWLPIASNAGSIRGWGCPVTYEGRVYALFHSGEALYFCVIDDSTGRIVKKVKLVSGSVNRPVRWCISLDPVNGVLWFPAFAGEESYVCAYHIETGHLAKYDLAADETGYVFHAPAIAVEDVGSVKNGTAFFIAYNNTEFCDYFYAVRYDRDAQQIVPVIDWEHIGGEATISQPILLRDGDALWLYSAPYCASYGGDQYGPRLIRVDVTYWFATGHFGHDYQVFPDYAGYVAWPTVALDYAGFLCPIWRYDRPYASALIVEDGIWY